jgi:hypothetical protein
VSALCAGKNTLKKMVDYAHKAARSAAKGASANSNEPIDVV